MSCNTHYRRVQRASKTTPCLVAGCEDPANAPRGWCIKHYTRWQRYGDPEMQHRIRGEGVEARFWFHVSKRGPDDCWEWQGARRHFGYGVFNNPTGPSSTHRYSWQLHNGPIPDGLWVLHHCDNPPCVNPAHLYVGDWRDNQRDMYERGRNFRFPPGGSGNPASKLTPDDVRAIRSAYTGKRGEKAELARRFGVSKPTIASILDGETWTWV